MYIALNGVKGCALRAFRESRYVEVILYVTDNKKRNFCLNCHNFESMIE